MHPSGLVQPSPAHRVCPQQRLDLELPLEVQVPAPPARIAPAGQKGMIEWMELRKIESHK